MVGETSIAWLTGIIDGEGCVTAKRCSLQAIAFRVTIESVSSAMIARATEILSQCGIEYKVEGPIWRERSTGGSYRIRVQKKSAVLRLCDLTLPYSIVKKPELALIKKYLDRAVGSYYSAMEEDLKILVKLRELKTVA